MHNSLALPTAITPAGRKQAFQPAIREHHSLLAGLEKRALVWIAHRLPQRINSDHLTLLGFLALFFAGCSYAMARWNPYFVLIATFFLAVNWFGDSLDGTVARVRNKQRPRYGFYVDHVTDALGALFLMGGLALSGFVHPAVAISMLLAFFLLSIEVFLATYTLASFHLSFWGFGPTEIRILLAIGNVALLVHPFAHIAGRTLLLFDVGGIIAAVGMFLMFLISALAHTRRLFREEPL